jgi:hypothetical protein
VATHATEVNQEIVWVTPSVPMRYAGKRSEHVEPGKPLNLFKPSLPVSR